MISKFVSESSNSFRFAKLMCGAICFMKDIVSSFFSGRTGISIPVFVLPNIVEASFIFSISSRVFSSVTSSARNEGWNLTSSMHSCNFSRFGLPTRTRGRYTWMWNFLPNSFFRAFAYFRVLSRYANGSPPVMPAPFAWDSWASSSKSFVELHGLSFAQAWGVFFLPSEREQYQHFLEHFPPTNRTSFWPFRQNLQPRHMSVLM